MSVLYTTHYMEEAERLCRRVGIVDHGKLLACGTRRELVSMVDEHDLVTVRVDGDVAGAVTTLTEVPGVLSASAADNREIRCMVVQASTLLPRLVGALTSSGIGVTDVRVEEPSLDSVFLHITGTALRD